jgi:protein-disulfide isomerase
VSSRVRVLAAALAVGAIVVTSLIVVNRQEGTSVESATPAATGTEGTAGSDIDFPAIRTPAELAHGRTLGSPDAAVTLDLWSDYQCPACDAFAGSVTPELVKHYIRPGKARLVIHDMTTIGNESLGASISARCAERQGKYWEYHDLLFANQAPENSGVFTQERSRQFATALGLDLGDFSKCLEDVTVEDAVIAETKAGLDQGIKETPSLYVDGELVPSANRWDAISSAIDAALAGR